LAGNKASSNFDQRHNLSLNYIYDLRLRQILHSWTHLLDDDPTNLLSPRKTGSGGGAWDSPVSRALLDDWQFSGIIIFQTGTPFTVINGGSAGGTGVPDNAGVANYFGTGSYADCIDSPYSHLPRGATISQTVGPLIDRPSAFVAPRGLTFGNCGRNSVHNP